jgi:serine/threonine-protein kinase
VTDELLDGRYALGPRLGEGGMGIVREALDTHASRTVAIKTLHPAPGEERDKVARYRRFEREIAAIGRIRSRHVVELLASGITPSGDPYLVMDRLVGRDLADVLGIGGQLTPRDTVAILAQLADAIDAAHALGIVHRDVKPSNIFLVDEGDGRSIVKLLDFGIAKDLQPTGVDPTTTGATLGTPHYMSPEQIMAKRTIDQRSDLWSLGVVAFRALAGVLPFEGESVGALAVALYSGTPPSLHRVRPELPPAVDAWFARACALDPTDRFPSASALVHALAQAVDVPIPPIVALSVVVRPPGNAPMRADVTDTLDGATPGMLARSVPPAPPPRGSIGKRWGGAAVGIALAAGLGVFALRRADAPLDRADPIATRTASSTSPAITPPAPPPVAPPPVQPAPTAAPPVIAVAPAIVADAGAPRRATSTPSPRPKPEPRAEAIAPRAVPTAAPSASALQATEEFR